MIRVKCPKCEKRLGIDESKAGGVAACPDCGQRFRIPGSPVKGSPASAATASPVRRKADPKKPTGAISAKQPPARPKEEWEEADSSPYTVIKEAEQAPPKEMRQARFDADGDDMDDEGVGLDREYLKSKREKKRKLAEAELIPGLTVSNAILIGLVVIWLALGAFAYVKPQSYVISLFLGCI